MRERVGVFFLGHRAMIHQFGERYNNPVRIIVSSAGLMSAQVSAPIYNMARKGRFKKTASGKFKRVKKIEGSEALAAEPSKELGGA